MSEFYNQGAVPVRSHAYIKRQFEEKVYQELLAERWVLLLGPRQHGKTTGLIRLRQRLSDAGFIVCDADLERLPPYETFSELLRQVSEQMARSLQDDVINFPVEARQNDFLSWLEAVIPKATTPLVIIIDECASIANAKFRNAFYGQIRQISSQRASPGVTEYDIAVRVRFVFSGTFRPETLVSEQNSPFNICERIYTDDLILEQARELARVVRPDTEQFVDEAFGLVGGQPFLLQTLFLETTRYPNTSLQESFGIAKSDLINLAAGHLEGIFSKVFAVPSLVEKVSTMVLSGHTRLIPADRDCTFLQIVGLAKREGSNLIFRSNLYRDVASESPQIGPVLQQNSAYSLAFPLEKSSLSFMRNSALCEVAFSTHEGATNAHNHGHYRLALTGFGSAVEALLIDFLSGLSSVHLASAIAAGKASADHTKRPGFNTRYEDEAKPDTWRFVNLINVARKVNVGTSAPEPSHALREWRNLVHPAEAVKSFVDESQLAPESLIAVGLFAALVRDISLRLSPP